MIIIDIETTGTEPNLHAIIDIAAIDFNNPQNQFHQQCQIRENSQIDPESLEYNGFKKEDLTNPNLPTTKQALINLKNWTENIKDLTIAGINPDFDISFLQKNYQLFNISSPFGYRKIDLHTLIYTKALQTEKLIIDPEKNYSAMNSDAQMGFVGLPAEPKPHNSALNGAIWETEAFSRIIKGKSLFEQFSHYPIPEPLNINLPK